MKTRVVITVDTEASIAGHYDDPTRFSPLIHEPVSGNINGRGEALDFLIRTLVRHGLIATFFVETLQTMFFRNDEMRAYASRLTDAGQDVQLHLHPNWLNFEYGTGKVPNNISDHCYDLELDTLVKVISGGCELIEQWTERRPTSMRTGNFSTNRAVFVAAGQCGLKTSSNLNVSAYIPVEKALQINSGVARIEELWEFPVTNFMDRGPVGHGRPRPLQITSLTFAEQVHLLNEINSQGHSTAVIITHPFEFIKRRNAQYEGMRPNLMVQQRFEKLCAYLDQNRDRFDVMSMEMLGETELSQEPAFDLQGHSGLALCRSASNFVNDRI